MRTDSGNHGDAAEIGHQVAQIVPESTQAVADGIRQAFEAQGVSWLASRLHAIAARAAKLGADPADVAYLRSLANCRPRVLDQFEFTCGGQVYACSSSDGDGHVQIVGDFALFPIVGSATLIASENAKGTTDDPQRTPHDDRRDLSHRH